MTYRIQSALFLSLVLTGGVLGGCVAPTEPSDSTADEEQVGEADSALHVKGKAPTKQLARGWTRWAMGEPWSTGPVKDTTGAACADGQDGETWFLAGTTGGPVTRTCTVPKGKELFFPLVNSFCLFPPEFYPDQASIDADLPLIKDFYAEGRANTCSLFVRVDGKDVYPGDLQSMDEQLYVLVDKLFQVDVNADNFISQYGVAGGLMPASTSGHFARIKALPPGDHVVELGGSKCDAGEPYFETSATYHLHIEDEDEGDCD